MLQIYYGDGKGKTTAAFGLALRAAGRGRRVVITQFLKSEDSGERRSMESVPHVLLLPLPEHLNFVWNMDVVERAEYEEYAGRLLDDTALLAVKNSVLILDEVLGAIETDILPASEIDDFLAKLPENCEVVLTGRKAPKELLDKADYITEFRAERHPFEKGVQAREGIEY